MHRIAQGDLVVNRSPVQLNPSTSKRVISAEILAANAHLQTQRSQPAKTNTGWLDSLRTGLQQPQPSAPAQATPTQPHSDTVKLYPSLALGMLEAQQETAGRIWLLCRALDSKGKGWLSIEELRAQLSSKQSNLHVCGWRRLRQLLQQGKGVFWERDAAGRVWLKSAEKVARALNIKKLSGNPVLLPIKTLTQSIRIVRAQFYTSFHSSRSGAPISRHTLSNVTGVPERTQRDYDQIATTTVKGNIALGGCFSAEKQQAHAYNRAGTFQFTDKQGKQGTLNQQYIAWRLPNSYQPNQKTTSRGRQRKINRWLNSHTDLVNNRAQGNSVVMNKQRIFFDNLSSTKKAKLDSYWRDPNTGMWHIHPASSVSNLALQK